LEEWIKAGKRQWKLEEKVKICGKNGYPEYKAGNGSFIFAVKRADALSRIRAPPFRF
jgi:hypothetical protein